MSAEDLLRRADEAELLAHALLEFASRVRASSDEGNEPMPLRDLPDLRRATANLLDARRLRHEHLDTSLFGEPAWEILLMLFHASQSGEPLPVTDVCRSAGPHLSVSKRWIDILVSYGLVEFIDLDGEEIEALRLTDKGVTQMGRTMTGVREIWFS